MPNSDGGRGGGDKGTPGSSGQHPVQLPGSAPLPNTIAAQARVLPVVYGTVKAIPFLIEATPPAFRQPFPWFAGSWFWGSVVASDGGAWKCLKTGASTNAPTGQGADPAAWAGVTAYVLNDVKVNGSNAYQCTKAGTSAATGGPSGTGTAIVDGSAAWMYLGPTPFPVVKNADNIWWRYLQQLPYPLYRQFFLAALCEGEVQGALSIWWDKERYAAFASGSLGTIALLTGPDAANQIPTMGDSAGYQHTALLQPGDATPGGGILTGTQAEVPALAVELQGVMFGVASPDVNPADIVNDLLTHTRRGCGWPSSRVDATTITGAGATSFRTYCDAAGLRFSMYIDTQRSALSILADILNATNSDAIWSQGALKIVPLGDQSITAPAYGAVNYVPSNVAQYNLSETDFLEPVQIVRGPDADSFNDFPVEFIDRSLVYQRNTVEDPDQTDIEIRGGLWRGGTVSLPMVFPDGKYPIMLSRIYAQRSLAIRNTYTFKLPWRYLLLEPTDIVTLSDATMGLSLVPVRIVSMTEGEDFTWEVVAEDYPAGAAASGAYTPQAGDGYKPNLAGTAAAGIPTAFGTGALTSGIADNLWPNPASEADPPSGVPVGNNGTSAEWDYRANIGAGAHDGKWVRSLDNSGGASELALSLTIPTIPNVIARFEGWAKATATSVGVRLDWLDSTGAVLQTNGGTASVGAWTAFFAGGRAPAGAVRLRATLYAPASNAGYFDGLLLRQFPAAGPIGAISINPLAGIGSTLTPDCAVADQWELQAIGSGATTVTVQTPLNPYQGQRLGFKAKRLSSSTGMAVTWAAVFKMATWIDPSGGNSRAIDFVYDGTNWVQATPETADIPN